MADITTRTLRSYLASLPSGGSAGVVDQQLMIRDDLVGDMTKAVYDPQGIEADAFDRANHTGTQTLSTISDAGAAAALNVGTTAGTVAAGDHTHAAATTSDPGFMSSADKAKLDGVGRWLASVAALLSDTTLTYTGGTSTTVAAGDYVFTRSEEFSYVVLASGASNPDIVTAGGVKLQSMALNPKAFGSPATGAASDVAIFNQLVLRINAVGAGGVGCQVSIPAGTYDLKAGSINPILVSNVSIACSDAAIFMLRDGPVWTLGSDAQVVENIFIGGGQPRTSVSDTPTSTCSWVSGVRCARVFINNCRPYRVPHIFYGVTSTAITGIYLAGCVGLGMPEYHWVHLDTTANPAAVGSVLYLSECSAYPYAPPTNPSVFPVAITGISKANPAVVTAASHGFTTGDRVRIALVGGMTEVNGLDFTITALDANTFSLNGVNSTSYTTYTSGGQVAELHWGWQYSAAVVGIYGHWDTAEILGGLFQHYAYLWYLSAQDGTISFIWDRETAFDYGGNSRFYIELNNGFTGNISVNGGWTFVLNEDLITVVDNAGAGVLTDITMVSHTLGMAGGGIIDIPASNNRLRHFNVDAMRTVAVGRARKGPLTMIKGGSSTNSKMRLNFVWQEDPSSTYFNGDTWFRPQVGIKTTADTSYAVLNCEMNAATGGVNYDIPVNSTSDTLTRIVKGNRTRSGAKPEYLVTQTRAVTSTTVYKNNSGLVQDIYVDGGTVSNISKNGHTLFTATGRMITVNPLETFSVTYSVAPTFSESFRD